MNIKVIAFDADDTLWVNEPYFRQTEEQFCILLQQYASEHELERELLKIELANLGLYGYGIKGFILSMIEAAMNITQNTLSIEVVGQDNRIGQANA
jgi:putative hydrolase of the HAD superfamily